MAKGLPSACPGTRQLKMRWIWSGSSRTTFGGCVRVQWMRWSCQTKLAVPGPILRQRGAAFGSAELGTVAFAGSRTRLKYTAGERRFS